MSIFRQAIILAALVAFAITATALANGLVATDQAITSTFITASHKAAANNDTLTTTQDVVKVATALTGVVGLAGALCMGLAKKQKERIDSRIVKALALFPTMPLAVHLLGTLVISQMH